jgi:crossover junction endonuclease MUS81
MGREELINAARPYCDSSFEAAAEGSHYCAWSSMGTLIAKGLVIKVSNPAKFSLSKDGATIAAKLIQAPRNAASGSSAEPGGSSAVASAPAAVSPFAHRARPFGILGGDFEDVEIADDADEFYEPMFDEFDGNQVRDRWKADARPGAVASQNAPPARAAWQFDDDDLVIIDDPKAPLPAARRVISLPPHPSKVPPPPVSAASSTQSRSNEIHRTLSNSSSGWQPVAQPAMSAASAIIHRTKAPPQLARTLSGSSTQSAAPGVLNPAAAAAQPAVTHVNPAVSALFKRLRPADWRVIMLVDNREVAGRADRRHLIEQLHARGVDCEVRMLSLGDVMWIARPRDPVPLHHLPVGSAAYLDATMQNSVEIVLDCIVERKKIPDLACSIIDNRYIDQKIRLKETGLRRIVYLVEGDFRTQDKLQPEALQFAMCKTEAVDGLLVHHTMSIDGSISFLIQLDQQLRDECRRLGPPPPGSAAHHTFGNFSSTGRKNADNSVSLTFAKQLKMIRGLSSERCLAIARVYPTSALLIEAFERCATLAEERALLANLQWGPNKKPLGQAVAATVQTFFRGLTYM